MNPIPIHIVTGFLGSGKTTLIQKMLRHDNSHHTLVLINELGEIGLDDLLVKPIADNTYLLPSGCMCCTILNDVKTTLLDILVARAQGTMAFFDKIVIETTGLANPASILTTLQQDTHLKGQFVVHGMTCVIDGELAFNQANRQPEWLTQVIASQQWVLSKQDRVSVEQIDQIKHYVRTFNHEAVWVTPDDLVDMSALFARDLSSKQTFRYFFIPTENQKHLETETGVLEFHHELDWTAFGLWLNLLLNRYGVHILRIKGMLYLKDVEQPILLHGVQHCLYPPEHLAEPLWEEKVSRLVVITRGVSIEKIQHSASVFFHDLLL